MSPAPSQDQACQSGLESACVVGGGDDLGWGSEELGLSFSPHYVWVDSGWLLWCQISVNLQFLPENWNNLLPKAFVKMKWEDKLDYFLKNEMQMDSIHSFNTDLSTERLLRGGTALEPGTPVLTEP